MGAEGRRATWRSRGLAGGKPAALSANARVPCHRQTSPATDTGLSLVEAQQLVRHDRTIPERGSRLPDPLLRVSRSGPVAPQIENPQLFVIDEICRSDRSDRFTRGSTPATDRLRTLYSVSFAVSVKGFVETGSFLDNGCGRSHPDGRGNTAPEHGRSGWHIQIGRAPSPSGWHWLPVRTGYHGPPRGTPRQGRLAQPAGLPKSHLGASSVSVKLHAVR
jgi:hypothetical protein